MSRSRICFFLCAAALLIGLAPASAAQNSDERDKIERTAPAEQQLADALIAAKTAAERSALMAARRELVTPELVQILYRAGKHAASQGDSKEGLRL